MADQNIMLLTINSVFYLAFAVFFVERILCLMMFFQQEEYDGPRFHRWLADKSAWDKKASLWLVLAIIAAAIMQAPDFIRYAPFAYGLAFIAFGHGILLSRKNRLDSKKPLVLTARVKRILVSSALVFSSSAVIGFWAITGITESSRLMVSADVDSLLNPLVHSQWRIVANLVFTLIMIQLIPFFLTIGNRLLDPYEARIKAGFRREAVEKFNSLKPKVVAITGSFGKTSTKHILLHILSAVKPTLATPGSVNTEMGITRIIREQLTSDHDYFIVEMGAYGPGSITRLCNLTPPDAALITAVGAAHYERFKSLDTVAKAKFEIAAATAKQDGKVSVNANGIDAALLRDRTEKVAADYQLVGDGYPFHMQSVNQTATGLEITVKDGTETVAIFAPLFGPHQAENILLASAAARSLGLPWSAIKAALRSLPQIRHRTEVSQPFDGITVVNDAYNSNPIGFEGALIALSAVVKPGCKRLLITPGMVELGTKHDAEHSRLGKLATQHADTILIVTPSRIPTFVEAVKATKGPDTLVMEFENQAAAEQWAREHWKAGDAVLYENNLPDLYETVVEF